jgi:hypothetical protein
MAGGATFPPIDVFKIDGCYFLADGWHRYHAVSKCQQDYIQANIHKGAAEDALSFALKANQNHGVRRTNADKRRAVQVALEQWPDLSSRALGELCGVSHEFVQAMRHVSTVDTSATRKGADGKQYPAKHAETCAKCGHARAEHFRDGVCSHLLTPGKQESQCACMQYLSRDAAAQVELARGQNGPGRYAPEDNADKDAAESADTDREKPKSESYLWGEWSAHVHEIDLMMKDLETMHPGNKKRKAAVMACRLLAKRLNAYADGIER